MKLLGLVIAFTGSLAWAQEPEGEVTFRAQARVVNIPVRVHSPNGTLLRNLTKEQFRVTDNGVESHVVEFKNEQEPTTYWLVLDASGSMSARRNDVVQASQALLRKLPKQSKASIVLFDTSSENLLAPTDDIAELESALEKYQPSGGTLIYRAVIGVTQMIQGFGTTNTRNVILLLTDGEDNQPEEFSTVASEIQKIGATIFPIYFREASEDSRLGVYESNLRKMAVESGGELFPFKDSSRMGSLMQIILEYSGAMYTLMINPAKPTGAENRKSWRALKVTVPDHPKARVFARASYCLSTLCRTRPLSQSSDTLGDAKALNESFGSMRPGPSGVYQLKPEHLGVDFTKEHRIWISKATGFERSREFSPVEDFCALEGPPGEPKVVRLDAAWSVESVRTRTRNPFQPAGLSPREIHLQTQWASQVDLWLNSSYGKLVFSCVWHRALLSENLLEMTEGALRQAFTKIKGKP